MLLNVEGKLVKKLDFRGTGLDKLNKLNAHELLLIITQAQQAVNMRERFKSKELVPKDWKGTVYEPILNSCKDKKEADKLLGVIIKQALIMTPLLFRQVESSDYEQEGVTYVRESLDF
jgi:hypothetical protein